METYESVKSNPVQPEPKEKKKYATEIIAYAVMKALGIKGEELN